MSERPEREEFERVISPCLEHLFVKGLLLAGNRYLAEDLVQEVLTKAWALWQKEHDVAKLNNGYLYRSLVNARTDLYRRAQSRVPETEFDDKHEETLPSREHVENEFIFNETARILWGAVGELSSIQYEIIMLVYVHQYSDSQAADKLGLTARRAKTYRGKALRELRKKLESLEAS